jgi:hypothetical protein
MSIPILLSKHLNDDLVSICMDWILPSKEVVKDSLSKCLEVIEKNACRICDRVKRLPTFKSRCKCFGFLKPVVISNELCAFIGEPMGTKMSKVDVTKHICNYIRDNNLTLPEDRRIIVPDEALRTLFQIPDNTTIRYFHLQAYLSRHYIRS